MHRVAGKLIRTIALTSSRDHESLTIERKGGEKSQGKIVILHCTLQTYDKFKVFNWTFFDILNTKYNTTLNTGSFK